MQTFIHLPQMCITGSGTRATPRFLGGASWNRCVIVAIQNALEWKRQKGGGRKSFRGGALSGGGGPHEKKSLIEALKGD